MWNHRAGPPGVFSIVTSAPLGPRRAPSRTRSRAPPHASPARRRTPRDRRRQLPALQVPLMHPPDRVLADPVRLRPCRVPPDAVREVDVGDVVHPERGVEAGGQLRPLPYGPAAQVVSSTMTSVFARSSASTVVRCATVTRASARCVKSRSPCSIRRGSSRFTRTTPGCNVRANVDFPGAGSPRVISIRVMPWPFVPSRWFPSPAGRTSCHNTWNSPGSGSILHVFEGNRLVTGRGRTRAGQLVQLAAVREDGRHRPRSQAGHEPFPVDGPRQVGDLRAVLASWFRRGVPRRRWGWTAGWNIRHAPPVEHDGPARAA